MSLYIPKSFENTNLDELQKFIERYNFATLVTHQNQLNVSHLPLLLNRESGKYGELSGHMAKMNSQWEEFSKTESVLCIFQGPHAYISPAWYQAQHSVPTWNYTAIHVHGIPRIITQEELSDDLTKLVNFHEQMLEQVQPYAIPEDYKQQLIKHIVGFRIEITKIEGKFKLGQNRSQADQAGMLAGLRQQNHVESAALADFIERVSR